MSEIDTQSPVSVEHEGRVFTGVGVSPESLSETMDGGAETVHERAESAETGAESPKTAGAETASESGSELVRDPATGQFSKVSRGRKRFERLNEEVQTERSARTQAEERAEALERRLAALEQGQRPGEPEKATERRQEASPSPAGERKKPSEDEVGVTYATYADFVEDLADWRAEQRTMALRQEWTQHYQSQQQAQTFRGFRDQAVAKYQDWDAVMSGADQSIQLPLSAMMALPNAADVLYTVAKDAALARKIAEERDPIRLGILIASVSPAAPRVALPASTPTRIASSAPAPYQPVGSGSTTTAPTLEEAANSGSDYDKSGFRELMAAERAGRRR